MADPTTELAKEFLEFHNYIVKKETKFYKNKQLKGTPGDVDIIAVSSKNVTLDEFELNKEIVAEVKNWRVLDKSTMDWIYKDKFEYINNYEISWKQLKKYVSSKKFERVLFCFATTDEIYDYAYNEYGVRIITTGFMIKRFCQIIKEKASSTYYPEAYHYNFLRSLVKYLYQSHRFKDKILLKDILWIDPEEEPRYRNQFNKLNSNFMGEFIYHDDERLIELMKRDSFWFLDRILEILKNEKLKSNDKKKLIKKLNKTLNEFQ